MTTTTLVNEAGADRRATWLELFFDLAFAAAIAEVGNVLSADYSVAGLLRFGFLFLLIWSAWIGHTLFSSRYDTDDLVHRVLTLGQMFAVAVMAVNAEGPLDGRSSAGFAAAYGALRLVLLGQYLRARTLHHGRRLASQFAAAIGAGAALWLGSSIAPVPARFVLWALALGLDFVSPVVLHHRDRSHHPAHLPERFGLFTLILLGESLAAMMAGMKHQEYWSASAAPRRFADQAERLERRWTWSHLPLGLGVALTAIGVEHVISVGGTTPLHGNGTLILAGGGAVVLAALAGIAGSAPPTRGSRAGPGLVLSTGVLLTGVLGRGLAPVVVLLAVLGGLVVLSWLPADAAA